MTREDLIKEIDERIYMNDKRINDTNSCVIQCGFMVNSELLKKIKTELQKQPENSDKTYEQGISYGLDICRDLFDWGSSKGMSRNDCKAYFNNETQLCKILDRFNNDTIIQKYKKYESDKEKVVVGDVVLHINTKDKFVVTSIENGFITGVDSDFIAHTYCYPNEYIKKTGKHVDL